MAAYYWVERVIKADQRVDIKDEMIGIDPRALKGLQQTQLTRIASLAIRELIFLSSYK